MLTNRQSIILREIINRFIETQEDVSSFDILKLGMLDVSSATIRNEMLWLVKHGYLIRTYSSSGRFPTAKAIKLYIDKLLFQESLIFNEDLNQISQALFKLRFNTFLFLRECMKVLKYLSGESTLITYKQIVQFYGLSKLVNKQNKKELKSFLNLIEDSESLQRILKNPNNYIRQGICAFIGESNKYEHNSIENCTIIYAPFSLYKEDIKNPGYIACIGYSNMNYKKVVPALEYISRVLNSLYNNYEEKSLVIRTI